MREHRALSWGVDIRPGLTGSVELVVGEEHTVRRIGSGRVRVLATPVGMRITAKAVIAAV